MKRKNVESSHESWGVFLCEDVVITILRRLPGKSLVRFKCVSKGWYSLISDLIIPKLVPSCLLGIYLISYRSDSVQYVLMPNNDDDDDDSHSRHEFCNWWPRSSSSSPLDRGEILGRDEISPSSAANSEQLRPGCLPFQVQPLQLIDCCNGLFLFEEGRLGYCLWGCEPPQFIKIPLPPLFCNIVHSFFISAAIAFNVRESSVHYKVVRFLPFDDRSTSIYTKRLDIFYSETGKWIEHRVEYKPPLHRATLDSKAIYLDGALYKLSDSGHLVRFNLEQVNVTAVEVPYGSEVNFMNMGCIGLSFGYIHYTKQQGSSVLVWMFRHDDHEVASQWVLKHSISCQDLARLASPRDMFSASLQGFDSLAYLKDIYARNPPESRFFPLDFHPCSDAVFLWSFGAIFLYHYKKNECQLLYHSPLETKKSPPIIFLYLQCLVRVKSFG